MSGSPKVVACVPRALPRTEWLNAVTNAIKVNPANRPPDMDESDLRQEPMASAWPSTSRATGAGTAFI